MGGAIVELRIKPRRFVEPETLHLRFREGVEAAQQGLRKLRARHRIETQRLSPDLLDGHLSLSHTADCLGPILRPDNTAPAHRPALGRRALPPASASPPRVERATRRELTPPYPRAAQCATEQSPRTHQPLDRAPG